MSDQCVYPTVSFSTDVMPIFDGAGCGATGCHAGAQPKGELDMSTAQKTYDQLVGVSSVQCTGRLRVEAGSPTSSYLIDKLVGTNMCSGNQMPKGGTPLSTSQIDTIRAWIGNGAPNN